MSTAFSIGGDRLVYISLRGKRLKEGLYHTTASVDFGRNLRPTCFNEKVEKLVQMPSGGPKILSVTVWTGTGAVMVQEM